MAAQYLTNTHAGDRRMVTAITEKDSGKLVANVFGKNAKESEERAALIVNGSAIKSELVEKDKRIAELEKQVEDLRGRDASSDEGVGAPKNADDKSEKKQGK